VQAVRAEATNEDEGARGEARCGEEVVERRRLMAKKRETAAA
jgi:hypothetical protein